MSRPPGPMFVPAKPPSAAPPVASSTVSRKTLIRFTSVSPARIAGHLALAAKVLRDLPEVGDQRPSRLRASVRVRRAQHRGRVHCREDRVGVGCRLLPTSALRHTEALAEHRLSSSRAETHDDFRLDQCELLIEPRTACRDLAGVGLLVDATFRFLAALPLEALHGVADVDVRPVDPGFRERFIEQTPGGSDEGMPLAILRITGLLATQHDLRRSLPFAEYRL